jgi:hypothetical protein
MAKYFEAASQLPLPPFWLFSQNSAQLHKKNKEQKKYFRCNMWAKNTATVLSRYKHPQQLSFLRSLSTSSVTTDASSSSSPIADDGRHELWREGQSSDHDNEPRYVRFCTFPLRRMCTKNACPSVRSKRTKKYFVKILQLQQLPCLLFIA